MLFKNPIGLPPGMRDYSKYGLTWRGETSASGGDPDTGEPYVPYAPAGYVDQSSGNYYTPEQAKNLIATISTADMPSSVRSSWIDPAAATTDARGTYAQLTRNMYDEWARSFQPLEKDLLSKTTYAGNPGVMNQIMERQGKLIDANFDRARNDLSYNAAKFGMTITPEQLMQNEDTLSRRQVAATVGSRNGARQFQMDLNRQIVGSGTAGSINSINMGV